MAALSIDPDYLRRLVVKVRSFMGKEASELPDDGSNPTDDALPTSALQEADDDLSREVVVEEIMGLVPHQRAELVALMWLGRDDGEAQEFEQLVAQALERREVLRRITSSTIRWSRSIGSKAWSGSASGASRGTRRERAAFPAPPPSIR